MAENKLESTLEGLNDCLRAIERLKFSGQRNASNKISEFTLQRDKFIARLVNFGKRFPIVRVTLKKLTTNDLEYAFYTDITLYDAELFIKTKLGTMKTPTHSFVVAETIILGWEIPVANKE